MAELEAIEAAARAIWAHQFHAPWSEANPQEVKWCREMVAVVAPILERQVREREAQKLLDWAETFNDGTISGPRATMRRHIRACASRISPDWTPTDIAAAIASGNVIVCHTDDAGRSLARGRAAHEHRGAADQTGEGR